MIVVVAAIAIAEAQAPPAPPASQNPVCARLESQLNALDRGGSEQARMEQLRRLEDAANKQQFELDRLIAQSRREGCGSGFFLFGGQPAQCGQINAQVQQARAVLDRIHADIDRLRQPGAEREGQRRSLLIALAQNDCGPQYRQQAAAAQPRGFFETLFGGLPIFGNNPIIATPPPAGSPNLPGLPGSDFLQTGTYRTLCVRLCDGFYFPISFAVTPSRFREDERVCQRTCPAAEVALYVHRNPGEDVNQAVSLSGQPYTQLPNAFLYRKELVSTCGCRRPGETWAQALKHLDSRATIESGDILVDEQRAKQLSQPRVDAQGRPIRIDPRARPGAGTTAETGAVVEGSEKPDPNRKVRSVGPTFLPGR
ncbi:MAG TPA: DUF2865 domain-containing protein [Xanthobacteraceae bacterium]|nr:DUF2865 domain-containing protein [Xanthobacteraceae bacterium]